MNNEQLELPLKPSWIHRYQILDAQSDYEEHVQHSNNQAKLNSFVYKKDSIDSNKLRSHYDLPSGNPYAHQEEEHIVVISSPRCAARSKISAKLFERETSRILRQYSPTVGKRRIIRPDFRNFIDSHIKKSSEQRAKILSKLGKYDLQEAGFAEPLFNREISDRMLKKLYEIGDEFNLD